MRAGVLEGDDQGSFDADRLADLHIPVTAMRVSARTGEGVDAFRQWLVGVPDRVRVTA